MRKGITLPPIPILEQSIHAQSVQIVERRKTMDNIVDIERRQKDRWKLATSCKDPKRPRSSESIPTLRLIGSGKRIG